MVANATPTLSTYLDIFHGIIETWGTCEPWAQPLWVGEAIFYACCIMTLFYIYVLVILTRMYVKKDSFRTPFHRCALVLATGEMLTIVTASKAAAIQICVLGTEGARHLAWESLGAFSADLIIGLNLVIALIRMTAVFTLLSKKEKSSFNFIFDILLGVAVLWAITIGVFHYFGIVKQVWYPTERNHQEVFFFPFDILRAPMQFTELGVTFLIYVLAAFQLQRIKKSVNMTGVRKEAKLLTMAILIFLCELLYIYADNWIGYNVFHWGSVEFNFNLSFIVRPITTGITPVFYLVFSTEIREACLPCWKHNTSNVVFSLSSINSESIKGLLYINRK